MKISNQKAAIVGTVIIMLATLAALVFSPTTAHQCKSMCGDGYVPHLTADGECSCTSKCEVPGG